MKVHLYLMWLYQVINVADMPCFFQESEFKSKDMKAHKTSIIEDFQLFFLRF